VPFLLERNVWKVVALIFSRDFLRNFLSSPLSPPRSGAHSCSHLLCGRPSSVPYLSLRLTVCSLTFLFSKIRVSVSGIVNSRLAFSGLQTLFRNISFCRRPFLANAEAPRWKAGVVFAASVSAPFDVTRVLCCLLGHGSSLFFLNLGAKFWCEALVKDCRLSLQTRCRSEKA